jgi:hypothetical protein
MLRAMHTVERVSLRVALALCLPVVIPTCLNDGFCSMKNTTRWEYQTSYKLEPFFTD